MSKKPRDVDLDEGIAPEKEPRVARGTDAGWPATEQLPSVAVGDVATGIPPEERVAVTATAVKAAHEALLALEARCDAGGSAGLADIRRVLKALRGG